MAALSVEAAHRRELLARGELAAAAFDDELAALSATQRARREELRTITQLALGLRFGRDDVVWIAEAFIEITRRLERSRRTRRTHTEDWEIALAGVLRDATRVLHSAIKETTQARVIQCVLALEPLLDEGSQLARRTRATTLNDTDHPLTAVGLLQDVGLLQAALRACDAAARHIIRATLNQG